MLAEAIQPERFVRCPDFSISANFGVTMLSGPFGNVGVEAFAILDDRGQHLQWAALLYLRLQSPGKLVAGLRFDGNLALRTVLGAETREEQAQEMIDLRDGGHRAFAATARVALLDADGGRYSRDQINVGPDELLDKLPRVGVHRIEKAPLAFGKKKIERQRALA